jgi:acyl carrier protein
MTLTDELIQALTRAVGAAALPHSLTPDTPLLGAIPELDSMALLALITEIESMLRLTIPDDAVSAEAFATLGSLGAWVEELKGAKSV